MIGLFDSGLGGLTVVRRVRAALPRADLVFFSDQAHVPYGDRSVENLQALLTANLAWLDARGVDAIVMACNTSCAVADVRGWPPARAHIFDLIDAAASATALRGSRRVGVVATVATVRSGAYTRRLQTVLPHALIHEVAAPALVPLVEAGDTEGASARAAVAAACDALPRDLDAVVLACTHYPVLEAHFAAVLGSSVALIDPAVAQAERVATFARELGIDAGSGRTEFVTSGDLAAFRASVARIVGTSVHPCVISRWENDAMTSPAQGDRS